LRRGILHNAEQREDGSWVWRYARFRSDEPREFASFQALWDLVSEIKVPVLLARGMREQSVVDDADEAELLRRLPQARVVHVEDAGHSLQGDTPLELARLISDFVP
jgi:pimeloyl-ACP methyl ester carboxylesterase